MAQTALVPVFTGILSNASVQLCNARDLHAFMAVLRDFSDWIKGRIRKFGFVEGVDFLSISRSPVLGSGNRGASIDYHLTLDMAKELSMVENNVKGREARRYFIDCEKAAHTTAAPAAPTTINPAQAQHLRELVDLVVESGKQSHGETWSRLHRKMHVNSYLALRPDQFDAACQYLRGKFDDTSIATLIQKHLPNTVAAIQAKNALQSLPAPQPPAMDVQTLCQLILGGIFTGQDFVKLSYAVNQRQFVVACNNKHQGYGAEVASRIKDGMSLADLHAINVAASMEVWMRSEIPIKAA